jgi:hypothetical protein
MYLALKGVHNALQTHTAQATKPTTPSHVPIPRFPSGVPAPKISVSALAIQCGYQDQTARVTMAFTVESPVQPHMTLNAMPVRQAHSAKTDRLSHVPPILIVLPIPSTTSPAQRSRHQRKTPLPSRPACATPDTP